MTRFIVHTDVLEKDLDSVGMSASVPQLLRQANFNSVAFKGAYVCRLAICHCIKDRKIICEFDSSDQETLRTALMKISLPITAILARPN